MFDEVVGEIYLDEDLGEVVNSSVANQICLVQREGEVPVQIWNEYENDGEGGFLHVGTIVGSQLKIPNEEKLLHQNQHLKQLVNDFEAANIRRQGEIESLRKELEAVHKSYREKLTEKNDQILQLCHDVASKSNKRKDKIVDYSLVDPDLLRDYAVTKLQSDTECPDQEFDVDSEECEHLRSEIEKQATFHPHVQQQIVKDEQGRKRFRKNVLIDQIVEQAGSPSHTGQTGLNYVATLPASREDRAQLAQLMGYSVDGYLSLSYALPVEGEE